MTRVGGRGQTFGYKPWSDFGPLGRNRALPSCHSSLYQQRDEEPSSLEKEPSNDRKERRIDRRTEIKQTRGCFYNASTQMTFPLRGTFPEKKKFSKAFGERTSEKKWRRDKPGSDHEG